MKLSSFLTYNFFREGFFEIIKEIVYMENLMLLENITEEEANLIYEQGREAVVFKILELSIALRKVLEKQKDSEEKKSISEISRPSGAIPVYEKENVSCKREKRPGRKEGHQGESRKIPD